jgi:2-aminoadipate transaminase
MGVSTGNPLSPERKEILLEPVTSIHEELPLTDWARGVKRSMLQEMLEIVRRPGVLSFALGLPAPELFPKGQYAEACAQVLEKDANALQYGPSLRALKQHIVSLMALRGVACGEGQIFLTAGAQQGMNLLMRLFLREGGRVLLEELAYPGFLQVISPYQPEMLAVPTDSREGIDVEEVELLLRRGARPAAIYVVTDGHNPLGVSLPLEKRRRLVELARQYRTPIVEDDAYGFLYYEDEATPPLRALDEQWVFYIGSFSKILAPALRVGWLVVPESLMPALSIVKESSDIDTSTFSQRAVSAFLDTGQLPSHLAMLRREYRARRDIMQLALQRYFPPQARWKAPTSGLFIWVELPEKIDVSRLVRVAVEEEKVAFIPGNAFSVIDSRRKANCIRLNFSNCDPARIEEGIALIARVLDR